MLVLQLIRRVKRTVIDNDHHVRIQRVCGSYILIVESDQRIKLDRWMNEDRINHVNFFSSCSFIFNE
jgi:hypothetical protein